MLDLVVAFGTGALFCGGSLASYKSYMNLRRVSAQHQALSEDPPCRNHTSSDDAVLRASSTEYPAECFPLRNEMCRSPFCQECGGDHKLLRAFETIGMGIIICDIQADETNVIFANDSFCELLDMPRDEILGARWSSVFTCLQSNIQGEKLEDRETRDGVCLEWKQQEGKDTYWHSFTISTIFDDEGQPTALIGIQKDITNHVIREKQINQSQKLEALGQLAGGVAHDFNNILSIIDGYTKMARLTLESIPVEESKAEDAEAKARKDKFFTYFDRISQSTKRGAALTRQLLTFGRHKIVGASKVNISDFVVEQEQLLLPLLGKVWDLKIEAEEGLAVDMAPDSVSQIMMNLVINARDAMQNGGDIKVRVYSIRPAQLPDSSTASVVAALEGREEWVCLSVADTGTGIPEDIIDDIFNPFFTTKDQSKGTGLGLSMIYGLVQQAGGHIDVETEIGKGTAFHIYLPRAENAPAKTVSISAQDPSKIVFEGYTACVAEDEEDLLFVMSAMLEDMGIEVLQARSGNEALFVQDEYEGEIDFLITDIMMPEMNGVKLAEMFAEMRPDTKTVFVSGYPANADMPLVSLPEDSLLLAKPIEYEKLAYVLQGLVQKKTSASDRAIISKGAAVWEDGIQVAV